MKMIQYLSVASILVLVVFTDIAQADQYDITHVISDLQKEELILGEVCVSGVVTRALSKDNSFYMESLESDRDADQNTSEGLRVYVGNPDDRSDLLELQPKDVVTVCGQHNEYRNIRPIPVLKYDIEVIEANKKVMLSLNQPDPITSLVFDRLQKTGAMKKLPKNTISCPNQKDENWLEAYENMRLDLGTLTVIKAGDPLHRPDFRFFAKGETFDCPVPITLNSGRQAFEPGTTLESIQVIVTEGPFTHELTPVNDIKVKKAANRTDQTYPKPPNNIRIAAYNVRNLEPVKRDDALNLCQNASLIVEANEEVKKSIQQQNNRNSDRPQKKPKNEYCSVIRSRLGTDKAERLASQIHSQLDQPDIIALQEIQDDDGALPTNNLSAGKTLKYLTDALNSNPAANGVRYTSIIDGNNQESLSPKSFNEYGGLPGANIRNAFIIREDFLTRINNVLMMKLADDYQFEEIDGGKCGSTVEDIYHETRAPVVLKFSLAGTRYTLVNVHQSSNFGGETPEKIMARFCQNAVVADYVAALRKTDKDIKVLVGGDFNDDPASMAYDPLKQLQAHPLQPGGYTHIFNGHPDQLDYFFSLGFEKDKTQVTAALINAQYTNGASDHNPVLFDFEESEK